jgi:hypothetical protein
MKHKQFICTILLALLSWVFFPVTAGADSQDLVSQENGVGIKPLTVNSAMDVPTLTTSLSFNNSGRWAPEQVVMLDLLAYNLQDAQKFITDVKYNPKQLRLISVSRGTFCVEDQGFAEWNSGEIDNQNGLVTKIFGIRFQPFSGNTTTLMRLNFIVIDTGSGEISLVNPKIVNSRGIEQDFNFTPLPYQIEK